MVIIINIFLNTINRKMDFSAGQMAKLKIQNSSFPSSSPMESFHWSTKLKNFSNFPFSSSAYYFLFFLFYPPPKKNQTTTTKKISSIFSLLFCLLCIQAWALLSLMIISVFILSYRKNEQFVFPRRHFMWLPGLSILRCPISLHIIF